MLLNKLESRRGQNGFTLVELLVTMLIVTVGLLGLAKLQATAVSNSSVARTRALMTYQAESLAGMMRANKGFWLTTGSPTPWPFFGVSTAGVVSSGGMPSGTKSCLNASPPCSPAELAKDDMTIWAAQFNDGTANSAFPGAKASITCVSPSSGTCAANPATPNGYDITLTWYPKAVAINRSSVNTAAAQPLTMVMHVQP